MKDVAFSYDQALASQVFLLFGDLERTKKIFDLILRRKVKGGFTNAYYASTGKAAEILFIQDQIYG